jgi:hypothetical protein
MLRLMIGILLALLVASVFAPVREASTNRNPLGFDPESCSREDYPDYIRSPMKIGNCIEGDPFRMVVTWKDQAGEAAYRVSGSVSYFLKSCEEGSISKGDFKFSEILPAGTTWYSFPDPENGEVNYMRQPSFRVEALDKNGRVMVEDGWTVINEPPDCPRNGSRETPDRRGRPGDRGI